MDNPSVTLTSWVRTACPDLSLPKVGGVAAGLDGLGLGAFLAIPSVSHPPQETGVGLAGTCQGQACQLGKF